jgi:hypothetical protein
MTEILKIFFVIFNVTTITFLISCAMTLTDRAEKIIEIIWLVSFFMLIIVLMSGHAIGYINI